MAGNTDNPRVWATADVYLAPTGSTAPTDVATGLDAAFEAVGLLSDEGFELANEKDATDHSAYGIGVFRTTNKNYKETFKFIALENNAHVNQLRDPAGSTSYAGGVTTRTRKAPTSTTNRKAWVLETVDGDYTRRLYIPTGEVTDWGTITIADDELETFELTVTIYPDGDGVMYYDISDDPAWNAS